MTCRTSLDFEEVVVCIGHVPPLFSLADAPPLFMCEQDIGVADSWIFGEEYPDLMKHGHTLSEYSALFALLRRMRKEGVAPRRVILTQYRKFVVNQSIGKTAENMHYVNTISGDGLSLKKKDLEPVTGDIMASRPIDLKMSVLAQYSKVHVLRDLLAFASDAIDRGVISNAGATEMIDSRLMIPAPTLGCYDGTSFVEIFSLLEQAAVYFLARNYQPRGGYQRRVLGFCLERLHSYLLLKRLGFPELRQQNFGWQVVVSDTASVPPTI